ncbi:MAG: FG-GAP-like repeat-containing protein, partial [Desulfovibrionaceae bacterium]|nr:FG-GAP-like repeat-containing protein [Desulfovibrionaceae bacterium]
IWTDISSAIGVDGVSVSYDDAMLTSTATIHMKIVDVAGNDGTPANQLIQIITDGPTAVATITAITEDTGESATDFITSDNTLVVSAELTTGTLGAGDKVQISLGDGVWHDATETSPGSGVYQYDATVPLDDGAYTFHARVVNIVELSGPVTDQIVIIDTATPLAVPTITTYTDDVGAEQGQFGPGTTTDDRQPVLNGTLNTELADGERVAVFEGSTFIGYAEPTGPLSWSLQLPNLHSDTTYTYTAHVVDTAGNAGGDSNGFTFSVHLVVTVNSQNTTDTTPIITGATGFAIMPGEYVEVSVGGHTYTSQDGMVVVDPRNNTWYVQIPDADALDPRTYDVVAVLKDSGGNIIAKDDTRNELFISQPATIINIQPSSDPDNKATAMTIGENGQWRLFANQTVLDANGTDSTSVLSFKTNTLTGNRGVFGSATFIDFNRDGLMDLVGDDSYYQDGQQAYLYHPGAVQQWTGTSGTNTNALFYGAGTSVTNNDYIAFQIGSPLQGIAPVRVDYSGTDANGNTTPGVTASNSNYDIYSANCWAWYGGVAAYDKTGNGYVDLVYGDNTPNDEEAGGGYDTSFVVNNGGIFQKDPSLVYSSYSYQTLVQQTGQATPEKTVSTVDLNNDGMVDVVWGGNAGSNYLSAKPNSGAYTTTNNARLMVASNDGTGALKIVQIINNMLYDGTSNTFDGQSLTWADFNGDGYMDLFQGLGPESTSNGGNNARIYFNDGTGKLSTASVNATSGIGSGPGANTYYFNDQMKGGGSVAVDWNCDGKMDIIETPYYAGNSVSASSTQQALLFTNTTNMATGAVSFTQTTLKTLHHSDNGSQLTGPGAAVTGLLAIDLNWDGAKDLLLFTGSLGTVYIQNPNVVADGTSIHVKILDQNGINCFFGNTVQLFDSHGNLVSTQIINPQSGNQTNDSSALVDFYGLSASESYSLVLLRAIGGQSQDVGGLPNLGGNVIENVNAAWTDLKAGAANHCYVLTAEAGDAVNNTVNHATYTLADGSAADVVTGVVGTGYNDTFYATGLGSHNKYEGGGGTVTVSGVTAWSDTGGMDIVDYKLAGNTAIHVDLSITGEQYTGFDWATFSNIEGIAGTSGNDTFTDSLGGNNIFNGRGGNDTYNLIHGGHNTVLYELIDPLDPTGGNGVDQINGFTVGTYEATPKADRIDLSALLIGYVADADGPAHYINGTPTIDTGDNIGQYLSVTRNGGNTTINIDRDGIGGSFGSTALVTLNGVDVDLATLLANHQIVV